MKLLIICLLGAFALSVAAAFHMRYSYTAATTAGRLPVLYIVRVDHWTGRVSVAWMMGNKTPPTWEDIE